MMKRAKKLPTNRAPIKGRNVVRELCNSIEAATRGDTAHAGSEIRRAVTQGVKLFMAGAIDGRGAAMISTAAAMASKAMRARGAQDPDTARNVAESHRRVGLFTSRQLPADQINSANSEWFD